MASELNIVLEDFLHILYSKIVNSFFDLPLRVNKIKVGMKNVKECRIILPLI